MPRARTRQARRGTLNGDAVSAPEEVDCLIVTASVSAGKLGLVNAYVGFGIVVAAAFGVACAAGALTAFTYKQVAAAGAGIALAVWGIVAIGIFRGPDNPELGELGWTIFFGFAIAVPLVAWLIGARAGRAVRSRSS